MGLKKPVRVAKKETILSLDACVTVSGKIRYLHSLNWSQGDIHRFLSKHMGRLVRPQHVNNVLRTPVRDPIDTLPK